MLIRELAEKIENALIRTTRRPQETDVIVAVFFDDERMTTEICDIELVCANGSAVQLNVRVQGKAK